PVAAERNFHMFCSALQPLLKEHQDCLRKLDEIRREFPKVMQAQLESMWAAKLGLDAFNPALFSELATLMVQTPVDYTIFFRELSTVPDDIGPLKKSFYKHSKEGSDKRWSEWLTKWKSATQSLSREALSRQMNLVNPKYSFREWLVVPAYQQAAAGDYALIRELQEVMTQPYAEQSNDVEEKYYRLKPLEFFEVGGASHYSCSS
ncbi:protein adenylyltransferase SelO family protein, partial [Marinobacter segnicrescens]|uniref:protein adenylyltransferase SelO family protein n=1 Tax=Marinobacter segnicrescens TaxID=430453 RepID=UPI003A900816